MIISYGPFDKGYQAYYSGAPNPYDGGSTNWKLWWHGWDKARDLTDTAVRCDDLDKYD